MDDKLMYIPNEGTKITILYITISGGNVKTIILMNQPIKINKSAQIWGLE